MGQSSIITYEFMGKILNKSFAGLSVLIGSILILKFFSRVLVQRSKKNKSIYIKINNLIRKIHKPLGILIVLTGLVHGFFSSERVLSLNLGTMCWISTILIGLSWMIRNKLKNKMNWLVMHRILTIIFILLLGFHVLYIKFGYN